MVLVAFLCFAMLIAAWVAAPGRPVALRDLVRMRMPESSSGEVEMQH